MAEPSECTERSIGHEEGLQEPYESARSCADDWYAMKLVDDRQMLAIEKLLHHLDIVAHYDLRDVPRT